MSNDDDTQNYGLILLTAVVGAVVTAVLVYAVAQRTNGQVQSPAHSVGAAGQATKAMLADQAKLLPASSPSRTMPITPAVVTSQVPAPTVERRVYFEVSSEALPADAAQALKEIAAAAKENPAKNVLISGFHDASGNAAKNADLAKRRALAVRHALEAQGVSGNRLIMEKPALTAGGTDPAEARRVEVRLN